MLALRIRTRPYLTSFTFSYNQWSSRKVNSSFKKVILTLPFGEANLVREGEKLSIITYGMGVHWAKKLVDEMELSADVLDLRTLVPLDWNRIFESVKKCSRVLVLHEDTLFGGIGGEIAAGINEHCFEYLDAPVKRLASIDTPVPFDKGLENNFLPQERLKRVVEDLLKY
jgi:2-oxoisovalerate dehydrogenase E1 component